VAQLAVAAPFLPAVLSGAAGGLSAYSMLQSGRAARKQGEDIRTSSILEAQQLRRQAGNSIASAQRQALEEKRRSDLVQSRALAVAAAGGGSASDPTVVRILSDLEGEGAYRAAVALYGGQDRAAQLRDAADSRVFEGEAAARAGRAKEGAYNIAAAGSIAKGGYDFFSKWPGSTRRAGSTMGSGDAALLDAGTDAGAFGNLA
jgi:hypothetical protein